jgi:hypothetical protein
LSSVIEVASHGQWLTRSKIGSGWFDPRTGRFCARARELRREHPLLTTAAGLLGIRTSAQSFAVGARGERVVGRQLNRSRSEASRAQRLLDRTTGLTVPVRPAIVFVGARRVTVAAAGRPTSRCSRRPARCATGCASSRPVLEPGQVDAIYEAARRPASWQSR